jgi:transposase
MSHIAGASREQQVLFPDVLDDSIAEENPVRFIDALVESLDLHALGFRRIQPAGTGRPAYHPGDRRKLYIYGHMNRIRSGRRLAQETHPNVELLWLLRTLHPDFKTIADLRKDHVKAFKRVLRAFALLGKEWELFGQELVAIDGTKFKAVNRKRRNFTKAKLTETLQRVDADLERYLHDLDTADAEEAECQKPPVEARREEIRPMRERKGRYEGLMREMERTGQSQVSLTDPDSRAMPKSPNVDGGDNAQVAVDGEHQLFVVREVTNAVTDVDQLRGIARQAKEALEVEQIKVVAGMG